MPNEDLPSSERLKRLVLGAPRDVHDSQTFHKISLVAFLAWIGLGTDGLSSSSYGPDEAFRALTGHEYIAIGLAFATFFTVFIISYAYSRIIEHFPSGGGGYVVAGKLLGPQFGVLSGSALLVDYVLTISVSIASGADQIFSFLPPGMAHMKIAVVTTAIIGLTLLNLRGVRESVTALMPIFVIFLIAHGVLIFGGIGSHALAIGTIAGEVRQGFSVDMKSIGFAGILAILLRSYSMGAGTYTGIEAVSNGIQIMREPKIDTAKRTMVYMATSLALTAGGILLCYLLFRVHPEPGKTMNAVLLEHFAGGWTIAGVAIGPAFIILTLTSEAALLFVAAQTGFIDGPRVMSNMAGDSWLPHRFSSLSDRLTMQNGVILIAGAALGVLWFTHGDTGMLVLMYSINVFLTFSLSEMGMVRYWIQKRREYPDWPKHITIHIIGLVLCLSILTVSLLEKFTEGGWLTLLVTALLIALCYRIRQHYTKVTSHLKRLDAILDEIPVEHKSDPPAVVPSDPTAILLVGGYGGLGVHSLLSIVRLFPRHFKNIVFVSVTAIDAGTLKAAEDVTRARQQTDEALQRYTDLAHGLGFAATWRTGAGTDVLEEAGKVCKAVSKEFPKAIFFAGKLVFQREHWYQRLLHNETANQLQRKLQFEGITTMVLPVRVFEGVGASAV